MYWVCEFQNKNRACCPAQAASSFLYAIFTPKWRRDVDIPVTLLKRPYGEIDDAVIVELCKQQHLALPEDLREEEEEEPEQIEEDEPLEKIDIYVGEYSPPPKRPGFFAALFGVIAGVNMVRGFNQQHNGRCNGDCAHCPPHYRYR